jgi:DNA-binding transcriptional ArsR family regulator
VSTYNDALEALGDGTRRRIMELLRGGPRPVGEIVGQLPVSQPAVSQHLKVLKRAGLVTDRPEGNRRVYQLAPEGLNGVQQYLNEFWSHALSDLKTAAESDGKEKARERSS